MNEAFLLNMLVFAFRLKNKSKALVLEKIDNIACLALKPVEILCQNLFCL